MPLQFPSNPSINQTYQSGSTATYSWDGTKWTVVTPTATTVVTARSASFASTTTSASFATNSTSASLAISSSALIGSQATYLQTTKNTTPQSIPLNSYTQLTNFDTPVTSINAAEWNGTTGVFTATKPGIYLVVAQIQFAAAAYNGSDTTAVQIRKNGSIIQATGFGITTSTDTQFPPSPNTTAVVQLAVGDTIGIFAFTARANNTFTFANNLTIQELPSRIQR